MAEIKKIVADRKCLPCTNLRKMKEIKAESSKKARESEPMSYVKSGERLLKQQLQQGNRKVDKFNFLPVKDDETRWRRILLEFAMKNALFDREAESDAANSLIQNIDE